MVILSYVAVLLFANENLLLFMQASNDNKERSCPTEAAQPLATGIDQLCSTEPEEEQMAPLPTKRFRTTNVRLADFHYKAPSARSGLENI